MKHAVRHWSSLFTVLFALVSVAALFAFVQNPAHAQGTTPAANISVENPNGAYSVYEGQEVLFTVEIQGSIPAAGLAVQVETWEPNRSDSNGNNPTRQVHDVTFSAGGGASKSIRVLAYVDDESEITVTDHRIYGKILASSDSSFTLGSSQQTAFSIQDPPANQPRISIENQLTTATEGASLPFTLTRTGDTASALTVDIKVTDDEGFTRGNHWDPEPVLPSTVEFAAGSAAVVLSIQTIDDSREESTADLTVEVLPSDEYLLGNIGLRTWADTEVNDNDTAQVLQLKWGYIDSASSFWEPGESFYECVIVQGQFNCTAGLADGLFYYEDGRNFRVHDELEVPWPAHFLVSRRAGDIGKTVTFVVRVEHDRGWESPRHADWPVDPVTGNHYQEFPLTLSGNQRTVVGRMEFLDNGLPDPDGWTYSATIQQLEDAGGAALTPAQEAEYWTVNGQRESTIEPHNIAWVVEIDLKNVRPNPVAEGEQVVFNVERERGNMLAPLPVRVRTWEPNRQAADGTNPSEQIHTLTFPALPMTSQFVSWVTQVLSIMVATTDDTAFEPSDVIKAEILPSLGTKVHDDQGKTIQARIVDDDRPTIALSADMTTMTEGETVNFTLTRGNNTTEELIVGVQVEDPGGFLQGNLGSQVAMPSSVSFAPGDTEQIIALTPPDDWRDIPDSSFVFTVTAATEYEVLGSGTIAVTVADNDVAPQVQISFNHAEVEEGDDLILTISRIGETTNPLEVPLTAGIVGSEAYIVAGMDAGQSTLTLTYHIPDDNYKGPDRHYSATLHPELPEFWTPVTPLTVTGAILDNDLYTVGVEALDVSVDEGRALRYRVFHNGHTGKTVAFNLRRSENGSAANDALLGDHIQLIFRRGSDAIRIFYTESGDGSDGNAEFVVELLPGDGYTIDPNYASASIVVEDKDPLPTVELRERASNFEEGSGTAEVWLDLSSNLPVLRTVSVDYVVNATGREEDITPSSGTLEFAPGVTAAVVEIPLIQDTIAEQNEQFTVVFDNPVFANLQYGQTELRFRGIILDDEPTVSVAAAATAVEEGDSINLTLTRTGDVTDELTAWLRVLEQADPVVITYPQVTFAAGSVTAEHTIETTEDSVALGSFTVQVTVEDPVRVGETRTYHKDYTAAEITVRGDDFPWVRVFQAVGSSLQPSDGSPWAHFQFPSHADEGEDVHFVLIRERSQSSLTVNIEMIGASDFITGTLPSRVTFPAGEKYHFIAARTEDDAQAEPHADLTLRLLEGSGYRPVDPDRATWTIHDNDANLPALSISANRPWVNEGEDVIFTLTRRGDKQASLEARVRLIKTRLTSDGEPVQETEDVSVTFQAGSATAPITRTTTNDSYNYGNATYLAAILPGSYYLDFAAETDPEDPADKVRVWVQDDDRPDLELGPTSAEYDEDDRMMATISRVGDDTQQLYVESSVEITRLMPEPGANKVELRSWAFGRVEAGESSTTTTFGTTGRVEALGATGRVWLAPDSCPDGSADCGAVYHPHYCPDDPGSDAANCAYSQQYFVGS